MAIRTTFVLEQHLGHRTYAINLRRFIGLDARLDARWVDVTYREEGGSRKSGGLLERLPIPSGAKGTWLGVLQTRRGLAAAPSDAAVFNTQVPAVFALDWLRRLPSIVCTDITPIQYDAFSQAYHHRADRFKPLRWLKYQINRLVFQRAAYLVAWSDWVSQSFQKDYGAPAAKIRIIPPGVDLDLWRPRSQHGDVRSLNPRLSDRVEMNAPPLRILFVGGDFDRKGGPLLIEAFRRLDTPKAELHLVTRAGSVQENLADSGKEVHLHVNLSPNGANLRRLYQESDLFVLPAQAEAFGIAAVEACASGLPVIAARVGGLADIVEDGKTGILVPPGDVDALTSAMQTLLSSPQQRREMSQAARARAESLFDMRTNAAAMVDLVEATQK